MKNDFFKHILLSSGSKQNRTEVETETLPYTFNSNSYKLRNYRIYGNTVNGESVGNLVTEGEHAGEYKVPVTVEGKNLVKNNHSTSSALFTVEEVNNFIHVSGTNNSGSTIAVIISAGNSFPVGKYDIVNNSNTDIMYDYKNENNVFVSANVNANSIKTFNFPAVFTRKLNVFKSVSNGNSIDNYFQVMIVKHGDDTDTYEPYYEPVTTNLYLPEPIKIVGDEAEYVDYKEQKQYFADGTSTDVPLPALPTLKGTNTLSVGTTVQPSKIWIQGNISEIETVSAETQALQTNIQSLQPLLLDENAELDVMPSDKNEFQTNDISEMPVEDENSIEEILETENLETTGDDENAE